MSRKKAKGQGQRGKNGVTTPMSKPLTAVIEGQHEVEELARALDQPQAIGSMIALRLNASEIAVARAAIAAGAWRVVCPAARYVEPVTEHLLDSLQACGIPVVRMIGSSDIALTRSQLAAECLRLEQLDRVLWVDSDQAMYWEDAVRLFLSPRDVITAVAVTRSPQIKRKLLIRFGDGVPAPKALVLGAGGGEVQIKACGFGSIVTSRRALEKASQLSDVVRFEDTVFRACFMPMVMHSDDGAEWLSEDSAFCHRLSLAGVSVWADTRIRTVHVGSMPWQWHHLLVDALWQGPASVTFTDDSGESEDVPAAPSIPSDAHLSGARRSDEAEEAEEAPDEPGGAG
jgi:hypothetical protein